MNELIGSFCYELMQSGNVVGEFTNNLNPRIFSESADRRAGIVNEFEGNYISTWREVNEEDIMAVTLVIRPMDDANGNKFHLTWNRRNNGELMFTGEGFLHRGMLVGHYNLPNQSVE